MSANTDQKPANIDSPLPSQPRSWFQVELVWNREFHFIPYGHRQSSLKEAVGYAQALESMGDGSRVKKTRIVDQDGEVVWEYGRQVKKTKKQN